MPGVNPDLLQAGGVANMAYAFDDLSSSPPASTLPVRVHRVVVLVVLGVVQGALTD